MSSPPSQHSQSFVTTVAPPDTNHGHAELLIFLNGNSHRPTTPSGDSQQDTSAPSHLTTSISHLTPSSPQADPIQRRKSYDDGVRPLNVLLEKTSPNQDILIPIGGLNVPTQTSRAEKRRSINPGLTLRNETLPNSASPEIVRSQTLPVRSDSPIALKVIL